MPLADLEYSAWVIWTTYMVLYFCPFGSLSVKITIHLFSKENTRWRLCVLPKRSLLGFIQDTKGQNDTRVSNWWQNVNFWVNNPFIQLQYNTSQSKHHQYKSASLIDHGWLLSPFWFLSHVTGLHNQFKHAFYLSCSITKGKENRGCWNRLMQWSSSHLHCSDWRSDEITHTGPTCHKHLSASWRSPQAGNLFSPPPPQLYIHTHALYTPNTEIQTLILLPASTA